MKQTSENKGTMTYKDHVVLRELFSENECIANVLSFPTAKFTKAVIESGDGNTEVLRNKFDEEAWKEFCEKNNLRYYRMIWSMSEVKEIYVNDSTGFYCTVSNHEKEVKIESANCMHLDGSFEHQYVFSLSETKNIYDMMCNAVFPETLNWNYVNGLSGLSYREDNKKFFPASDTEPFELCMDEFRETADFAIERKLHELIVDYVKDKKSTDEIEKACYRRINVTGDHSYCEDVLTVTEVGETFVKMTGSDETLNYSFYTSKNDFAKNFRNISEDVPELVTFLQNLFKNVINEKLLIQLGNYFGTEESTIAEGHEYTCAAYRDDICLPSYNFITKNYRMWCFKVFDKVEVSFKFQNEQFDTLDKSFVKGFITDAFLAIVDGQLDEWESMKLLKQLYIFINKVSAGLQSFLGDVPDEISEVLNSAQKNVEKVQLAIIKKWG